VRVDDFPARLAHPLEATLGGERPEQAKELLRLLVNEIRVHDRRRIIPTDRTPAAVREMPSEVELVGLEPTTSCMPCKRSPS
jgi:hypothetical protein